MDIDRTIMHAATRAPAHQLFQRMDAGAPTFADAAFRQRIRGAAYVDLAAAALWTAFRNIDLVEQAYQAGDYTGASITNVDPIDPLPAVTILNEMRSGLDLGTRGVPVGEVMQRSIEIAAWRHLTVGGDEFMGNLGSACGHDGQVIWRGVILDFGALQRRFPPRPTGGSAGARAALYLAADTSLKGDCSAPVGVHWRESAMETFRISGREARRVWDEVASQFGHLRTNSGKSKIKRVV